MTTPSIKNLSGWPLFLLCEFKSELIYRGLDGRSQFRIDVIILELDPLIIDKLRLAGGRVNWRRVL
jgi:hypothetical protein